MSTILSLQDSHLLQQLAYVDGQWISADDEATFPVTNPASGTVLARVPRCGSAETQRAIAAAEAAWPAWRARTAKERGQILRRWFDLMNAHAEDLAQLITAEGGKPLAEARGEVTYAASFVEWFAEEGKRAYGETIPTTAPDKRLAVIKQPIGVAAAITPWNFPAAMITRKVAPALAAGCPVVVKPAEQTPLTALALAELADRAGLPAGVFNVVTGDAADAPAIGATLTASPVVRKLSFTGSTEVGRLLMAQSAPTLKKLSLELGGNAPFIVFDDADVDAAVDGLMAAKYRNTGQTCVCANRVLVQEGIYARFAAALADKVAQLRVGNGAEVGVQQGPLIDGAGLAKVEELVADALAKGARVLTGGARLEDAWARDGHFFQPTVLAEVTPAMRLAREEIFGPVAPLFRFASEDEAVRLANATEYGLAAYFYSRDVGRCHRVSEALEYGMVGVNTGLISNEVAPFGGVKQSGLGREGAHYGLEEYLEVKYVCTSIA
ncbi:succinate semialdehyde dehydrogenase [NAD(P)+] [Oryzomicrobium terrae]|uniref:Succinate semialdehyde dehydrogenase [NAD(P)+] n=1 Tax=Oryzomicrobium terrae TaxID=1735038 RepID=A0A5C1ECG2_9RHOO|nr:NAD-dependent succinate-semialdehyde dehydrogenase [Oryzomicrobium terrae]QEL66309.1 succinate semialdehyde dehydrogenase [NAD(P)+] [Oryzomicrobium terrae]